MRAQVARRRRALDDALEAADTTSLVNPNAARHRFSLRRAVPLGKPPLTATEAEARWRAGLRSRGEETERAAAEEAPPERGQNPPRIRNPALTFFGTDPVPVAEAEAARAELAAEAEELGATEADELAAEAEELGATEADELAAAVAKARELKGAPPSPEPPDIDTTFDE